MTGHRDLSLIVAYGTDMGNAEDAATSFAEAVTAAGVAATAVELNQVDLAELQAATHFVVATSTFGDGEFPDTATLFWETISNATDRLDHLSFAVLALGDSGYEFFCNAGKLLDERLEALGATRLADRVDVDGPYRQQAAAWTTDLVKQLLADTVNSSAAPAIPAGTPTLAGREHHDPVAVRVAVNRLLTSPASDKEVRHYELDLSDSGITYHAGDSIAVHASNDPALVTDILSALDVSPDHRVLDRPEPLGVLLTDHFEIRTPSRALLALVASRTGDPDIATALANETMNRDVLDLIRLAALTVDDVVDTLRPLQPRDYSIASSPLVHPDQVHLTVASVRYTAGDRCHSGVASTFLADRTATAHVHLRPNHTFRLPAADVPIIMIGPGTGIAPFRAFLQERRAIDAPGPSWLFFGDRRRATDFLYGDELESFVGSGTLTRLDLAFSRDQNAKVYVQQRMQENADELFGWLSDGAHLYVCGDEKHMAKDVDATLHDIVGRCGAMDAEAAHAYVNDLVKNHRYVRDVY
ncbi:sulfite reductase flavoprotein subunit alpha [Mycobacterium sp. 155]|uniref:diflavin oxidoreductase n=1 Tax=Mycobacterium sp. 155 TaxID=1157943 RepID=UPI000379FA27|nr:sulfite reductase flavoprotein subunit alpha [Mycobacterium sp. 155]